GPIEWRFGPDAALTAERLPAEPAPVSVSFDWEDPAPAVGPAAYALRVFDGAGHFALGSPFYVGYGEVEPR
ncbi:MAG: hypothetical protein HUU35_19385, partial [Armatimonadetes bacterium]|nr:hypothetical protein [Armatimonadota bacterium]